MSWRTHGIYKGLSQTAKEWLKLFDSKWDTKDEGRIRGDAYDNLAGDEVSSTAIRPKSQRKRPQLADLQAPEPMDTIDPTTELEIAIALIAHEIARFTVPKQTRSGWSIHLVLKSGEKVRVPFEDKASAQQAYQALQESFSIKIAV